MKKIIIATVIITVLAGFYIFDKVESVRANPSRIVMPITCSTQGTGASSLSTTTGYTFITAGKATTTAGYINVLISNLTGTARVPSVSGVGSSTNYWYVDTN